MTAPALKLATVTLALALAGCAVQVPKATVAPATTTSDAPTPTLASPVTPGSATPSVTPTASVSPSASPSSPTSKPTSSATSTTTKPTGGASTTVSSASGALAGMVAAAGAFNKPSTGGVRLAPTGSGPLSGKTVMVDPGHNGTYISSINGAMVPSGGGQTKQCNTSGTAAIDGTPEHVATWAIGVRLVGLLRAQGATVVLARPNDGGVGPCVNERARIANTSGVDLMLSIHGDGALGSGQRGFHVIVSSQMAGGSSLQARSYAVAQTLVAQIKAKTPLPPSNYVGAGTGIDRRTDIAGVNLLTGPPGVMLEMGNMRSASDWGYLKTDAAKDAIAQALLATAIKTLG